MDNYDVSNPIPLIAEAERRERGEPADQHLQGRHDLYPKRHRITALNVWTQGKMLAETAPVGASLNLANRPTNTDFRSIRASV